MKGRPGPGGQPMGRPMTPFSMQQGGMQGFNTGMGGAMGAGDPFKQFQQMQPQNPMQQAPGYGNPSNFGQMMQAPGMTPFGQLGGDPNKSLGNLSQMANMIQGQGQMPQNMMPYQQAPQGQMGNLAQMASLIQGGGMGQQAPSNPMQQPSSTPMQQGLGGLGASIGRGG